MHRFYAPPDTCARDAFDLPEAEAHHALHVLRVRVADIVTVLNGAGGELLCRVAGTTGRHVGLHVQQRRQAPAPPCRITLFQALPKGKTLENIIHKATELGVSRIVPVISEHVIARPEDASLAKKGGKWQATAIEAIKQCGQPWLPKVDQPLNIADALRTREPSELEFVGALYPGSKHPRSTFKEWEQSHNRKPVSIGIWIGPEGDFTRDEVAAITRAGATPITLGPLVLKCDTAATYALSVVTYEIQSA